MIVRLIEEKISNIKSKYKLKIRFYRFSKGAKWQNRRRLIAPTFSLDILNDFITVFNDQAKILVDILKENQKNPELNEFDVIPYVSNCTLDILCGI